MYGLNMCLEVTLVYEFMVTLSTLNCFTFMFRLCVFLEMIRSCCFILTVLTLKCFNLMYGINVPLEMVLLCEFLTTARASNGFALMHGLSHYKMRNGKQVSKSLPICCILNYFKYQKAKTTIF